MAEFLPLSSTSDTEPSKLTVFKPNLSELSSDSNKGNEFPVDSYPPVTTTRNTIPLHTTATRTGPARGPIAHHYNKNWPSTRSHCTPLQQELAQHLVPLHTNTTRTGPACRPIAHHYNKNWPSTWSHCTPLQETGPALGPIAHHYKQLAQHVVPLHITTTRTGPARGLVPHHYKKKLAQHIVPLHIITNGNWPSTWFSLVQLAATDTQQK